MPVIKKRSKKEKLQTSTVVESRGVSTSRESPSFTSVTSPTYLTSTHPSPPCLTPTHNSPSCLTPTHTSPLCLTPTCQTPTLSTPPCHTPPRNIPTDASSPVFAASGSAKDSPTKATQTADVLAKSSHAKGSNPSKSSHSKENSRRSHRRKDNTHMMSLIKDESSRTSHVKDETAKISHNKDEPSRSSHGKEKLRRDDPVREDPNRKHVPKKLVLREHTAALVDPASGAPVRSRGSHHPHRRHSHQELDPASRGHGPRSSEIIEASTASVKQELLHLSLARQALEAEKVELTRLLEQRESVITELRKQMHQRDKAMHTQRTQFEDVLRNVQNSKRAGVCGDSPGGRGGPREELHLVRDAIASLRSNFRETDPNQHTLDTLEQAISILIERSNSNISNSAGGVGGGSNDKSLRGSEQRPQTNGVQETSTKVIYFTERTVTPFMSTINRPLGEIRLRDFKNMFDRPGLFRFHFKSYDPEYGMVKEEIVNDDDILPGVEGKIIAWVEEDVE